MKEYKEVSTTQHEKGSEARVTGFRVTQIIWLLLGLLEGLLGLRFIFKLIGVNPANTFAAFLYKITEFFVAPFANLIGAPAANGMVFEVSTLLAMIIYLLVGWALARIVYVLFYRPRGSVSTRQTVIAEQTPQQNVSTTETTTTQTSSVENQSAEDNEL